MNAVQETHTLSNGVELPLIGYGTYKAVDGDNTEALREAIEAGYRYFDTASFYGTEPCLAEAIQEIGLPREAFRIASKVWKTEMGYAETKAAFERTLNNLETDYLDLYLIHWPLPAADCRDWRRLDLETWRAMEELYEEGRVRAIGVSNFLPHHLDNLLENGRIPPTVDQLEFHPGHTQEAAVRYCAERGILVQAWSPMGRARVLEDPLVVELAGKHRVSPAQVCLRFALQRGTMPLPKASSPERMRENLSPFTFMLSREDVQRLETMPPTGWSGEHPDRRRAPV